MQFSYEEKGDTTFVKIIGVIENTEAEELVPDMQAILDSGCQEVIFDLTYVPFMTSAAIGKFVIFHKNLQADHRTMRIKGIDPELLELFQDIKLHEYFPIEP